MALIKHLKLMEEARQATIAINKGHPVIRHLHFVQRELVKARCISRGHLEAAKRSVGQEEVTLMQHLSLLQRESFLARQRTKQGMVFQGEDVGNKKPFSNKDHDDDDEEVRSIMEELKSTSNLHEAKELQSAVMVSRVFPRHAAFLNQMILMFGRCHSVGDAESVFETMGWSMRGSFTYNALLKVYLDNELWEKADQLFQKMKTPNAHSCTAMVSMYASQGRVDEAEAAFTRMLSSQQDTVAWNAMIGCYSKNKSLAKARDMFDAMPQRDVVSWNALVAAYAQQDVKQAREVVNLMPMWDMISWNITMESDGELSELEETFQRTPERDVRSWTVVILALARHGHIERSEQYFNKIPAWDLVVCNSMIAGYARSGQADKARELFWSMLLEGLEPSEPTFASLMGAFSYAGLLSEVTSLFHSMIRDFGFSPGLQQFSIMIITLARAGNTDAAMELINNMPFVPGLEPLMAMLNAFRLSTEDLQVRDAKFVASALEPLLEF